MLTVEQVAWWVEVEIEASGWLGERVAAHTAFTVSRWPRMVCWSSKMGWLVVLAMGMLIEALFSQCRSLLDPQSLPGPPVVGAGHWG